jgi:hypothetical protein
MNDLYLRPPHPVCTSCVWPAGVYHPSVAVFRAGCICKPVFVTHSQAQTQSGYYGPFILSVYKYAHKRAHGMAGWPGGILSGRACQLHVFPRGVARSGRTHSPLNTRHPFEWPGSSMGDKTTARHMISL